MSLNGSGTYTPPAASFPAVGLTLIESAKFNAVINDMSVALSTAIFKDGQQTVTANIPFNGFKLLNIGPATLRADATNLVNIQNGTGVYAGTVGGTADAITITPSPAILSYVAGQTFRFIASGTNTGAVTIDVSGLGVKDVTKNGTTALVAGDILSGSLVALTYDGTRFILGNTGAATVSPNAVAKAGDTMTGLLTLSGNPTAALHAAPKQYVDSAGISPMKLENVALAASVNANALTINLVGQNGSDPSSTNAVNVAMRHPTAANGTFNTRSITSALSLTLSAGSTLGALANETIRFYIWLVDSDGAGAMKLAFSRQALWEWSTIATTVAEGGAGAADSNIVLYSDAAYTSKPVRLIGVAEITSGATPGNWTAVPSILSVWVPGMRKTGDVVQRIQESDSTVRTTTSNTFPLDNTIPQSGEGGSLRDMTTALTPTSAINTINIRADLHLSAGFNAAMGLGLFLNSETDARRSRQCTIPAANNDEMVSIGFSFVPASVAALTVKYRWGHQASGSLYNNSRDGTAIFAGTQVSTYLIEEVYV